MKIHPTTFENLAGTHFAITASNLFWRDRRFRSVFHASSNATFVACNYWTKESPFSSLGHFIFKNNTSEHNGSLIWGFDKKSYREWVWYFVQYITYLHFVRKIKKFKTNAMHCAHLSSQIEEF